MRNQTSQGLSTRDFALFIFIAVASWLWAISVR